MLKWVIAVAMLSSSLNAQQPSWRLVVDNYSPYIDELAEDKGVLSQLVTQVLAEQKISSQIEIVPWQQTASEAAKPNSASFMWFANPDLQQQWYYSDAITTIAQVMVVHKDFSKQINRLDQLRGLKVGVVADNYYGDAFESQRGQLNITTAVSDYHNLQALLTQQIDLAIMDPVIAHVLMQQLPANERGSVRFLAAEPLTSRSVYLVCSRNFIPCLDFVQQFNQGLAAFKKQQRQLKLLGPGVPSSL